MRLNTEPTPKSIKATNARILINAKYLNNNTLQFAELSRISKNYVFGVGSILQKLMSSYICCKYFQIQPLASG